VIILKEWADTCRQLQIASEKCFVHRVTYQKVHIEQTSNLKSPYILDNNKLNWSKETRDLAIILDSEPYYPRYATLRSAWVNLIRPPRRYLDRSDTEQCSSCNLYIFYTSFCINCDMGACQCFQTFVSSWTFFQ